MHPVVHPIRRLSQVVLSCHSRLHSSLTMPLLQISGHRFLDSKNREVVLHGINVSGDCKLPYTPNLQSHIPDHFFDGDNVSFVNRPFTLEAAPTHLARLRRWGFDTIRYLFTWEALEHEGPGKYDEEFISYTVEVLKIAKAYEFKVFMDPHQDVWSRFSGGSGAPMWTLYACGLDPTKFLQTEAALVQNTWPKPEEFPKMIWATNYYRLVCQLIFTLFFAGKEYAPNAIIDGVNIEDYLQNHFFAAVQKLLEGIKKEDGLLDEVVIGWETMNEPNRGLIGHENLAVIPKDQRLQKGTSPTAWQAMLLGSGRPCEVEVWDVGGMGPYKKEMALIDPEGVSAWLSPDHDDTRYGWKRDPQWKLGECLWAQNGVWDRKSDTLLKPEYFSKDPRNDSTVDYLYFTNHWWMDHVRKYRDMVRSFQKEAIIFCQPPTLELPPAIKSTADEDKRLVYCPHWYDGLTLMTKKWNTWYNVDVLGVLRGRYMSPVFAMKFGETAIRNCFRDQLAAMRKEGEDQMGDIPCIFTETGIPFDMNDKVAYKNGNYSSQIGAMDAVNYALEGSKIQGYTLWNYTTTNSHQWGDGWNGEDLSIYSEDDPVLPTSNASPLIICRESIDTESPSFSKSNESEVMSENPSTLKQTLTPETMNSLAATTEEPEKRGFRAGEAFVRPWPIGVHGTLDSFGFDLKSCTFHLKLAATEPTSEDTPTEIFVPAWHYPNSNTHVEVSGGKWKLLVENDIQKLKWWHAAGEQSLTIKGLVRTTATASDGDSYYEQLPKLNMNCSIM